MGENNFKFKSRIINPFAYWIVPGLLAAGEYPGSQFSLNPKTSIASAVHSLRALYSSKGKFWNNSSNKIDSLLDMGIVTFIDLTQIDERPNYLSTLHLQRRKKSRYSNYRRFAIADKQVPSFSLMEDILEFIDLEIDNGRPVYVHCFRGLGRTGTVLGCWLVKSGLDNSEALRLLGEYRKGLAGDFRQSPETGEQRDFVQNWIN